MKDREEYISILEQDNAELKKQLEENKDNYNCLLKQKEQFEYIMSKQVDYQGQQKEFLNYLEGKIQQQEIVIAENQEKSYFLIYEDEKEDLKLYSQKAYIRRIILEEILQKYKSIIGVSDENKRN